MRPIIPALVKTVLAPEGAATLAALKQLIQKKKWVAPEEKILLLNTGSGLKYLDHMG